MERIKSSIIPLDVATTGIPIANRELNFAGIADMIPPGSMDYIEDVD